MTKNADCVAVIVGAGSKYTNIGKSSEEVSPILRWGLGGAISQRFAKECTVVLMGRRVDDLQSLVAEIEQQGGRAVALSCDVTDDAAVNAAFKKARDVGEIEILIYNAAPPYPQGATFANMPYPHEVTPQQLQQGFDVGVTGCLRCVNAVIEPMLNAARGTILLTGATQALRGAAKFASMSPVKFALRSLGQSLYQAYAPQGIHVAHVVVDGPIDSPGLREQLERQDASFLDPGDLADAYVMLANQPRGCWSYELQLTPHNSSLGMRL
ncbi:MAG: SDR family NAD(P)-dependent oxidoreductase [Pseudomonadota bacterium]